MNLQDAFILAEEQFKKAEALSEKSVFKEALALVLNSADTFKKQEAWEKCAYSTELLSNIYWKMGNYDKSIEAAEALLHLIQIFLVPTHELKSAALTNLGICYYHKKILKKAIDCHQQAIQHKEARGESQPEQFGKSYANIGLCYDAKGEYDEALTFLKKALTLDLQASGKDSLDTASSYNNIGLCFQKKGDFSSALDMLEQAAAIFLKNFGKLHINVAHTYVNIGVCHEKKGAYDTAIAWGQKALDIFLQVVGEQHFSTSKAYSNLGICFELKGDYDKAIDYQQKALQIIGQLFGKEHINIAMSSANLGICYFFKGDYGKAIDCHQKATQLFLDHFGENIYVGYEYADLGIIFLKKGEFEQAKSYFQKSLHILKTSLGENHPDIVGGYVNLGDCFDQQHQVQLAQEYYQQALTIQQSNFKKHPETANIYNKLGAHFQKNQQFDKASNAYQQAIENLFPSAFKKDEFGNPALQNYTNAIHLLETLSGKAALSLAQYLSTTDIQKLETAFATYQLTTQLIAQLRQSYQAQGSKLTLAQKAKAIYEAAIETALIVVNTIPKKKQEALEFAFHCSEQAKAILLLAHFKNTEAKAAASIPQNLLNKEYELSVELNYLDKRILELSMQKEAAELGKLQSERFDYLQDYERLIAQLENDYPAYYQLKYEMEVVTVAELQKHLFKNFLGDSPMNEFMGYGYNTDETTTLISYFIGEQKGYVFAITTTDFVVVELEKLFFLKNLIADFALYLEDPTERKNYLKTGYQLFQILLQKPLEKIGLVDRLIIIPDDSLSILPFEALLTQTVAPKTKYPDLPYLLIDYDISYHFSATLWQHGRQKKQPVTALEHSFIGFAPVYRHLTEATENEEFVKEYYHEKNTHAKVVRGESCLVLKHSESEVTDIADLFLKKDTQNVKTVLHAQASEQNFKKTASNFKYIHIAAHGIVNEQHPELSGILFSPNETVNANTDSSKSNGLLCISDVYSLQLTADLVVLSCCETGIGKLAKGEGMIALNRGFLYAGAKQVVYTLFKIPDAASANLMRIFYEQILKGVSHAAALRLAKIALIQAEEARPVKWAGFLLLG